MIKRTILTLVAVLILGGGWYAYRLIWDIPLDINHFADRNAVRLLQSSPELLTMVGAVENTPIDFHSNRLSDLSPETERRTIAIQREAAEQLGAYSREDLQGQRRLTYDYLEWTYGTSLALREFPYHFSNTLYNGPYPANQTSGLQELPVTVLSQFQQVHDAASAERYLERTAAVPGFLESLQRAIEYREGLGVLPPRVIADRLVARAAALVDKAPEEWPIYTALAESLASADLDDDQRQALLVRSLELLDTAVIPAYRQYLAFLEDLAARAPAEVGMWSLPDGDAYYQALLQRYTTTDMTPEQIHALGLERVEALRGEISERLVELGYSNGSYEERLLAFATSPDAVWEDEPGVREAILAEYDRLNQMLISETAVAFNAVPPQPLVVRAVPEEEQNGAAAAYYRPPALDGSRPGIFFVNLMNPADTQRFAMLSLAAHEGVPGHHFDSATSQLLTGLPFVRKLDYITAHGEGWALYTERLVAELGLHDAFSDMGRLQAEMFRAVRLVVDTGIHAKGWTRQQAIDYMLAQTGMSEGDVVSEIERYIAMPGQATAYMVGMLEILAMREEAKRRMGERFVLADFHDIILGNGALPLSVLRREVEQQLN